MIFQHLRSLWLSSLAYRPSKQSIWGVLLCVLWGGLAGCAGLSTPATSNEHHRDDLRTTSTIASVSTQQLEQALQAEFALQRGHTLDAYQGFFNLAQETANAASAERATRLAVALDDLLLIEQSTALWQQLAPNDARLYPVRYHAFIRSNRPKYAAQTLILADEHKLDLQFINQIIDHETNAAERLATIQTSLNLVQTTLPSLPAVMTAQVRLYFLQANYDEAIQLAQTLITRQTADLHSDVFLMLAYSQQQQGNTDTAITTLKTGLQYHPNALSLLSALLEFALSTQQLELAQNYFDQAPLNTVSRTQLTLNYIALLNGTGYALQAYQQLQTVHFEATGLADQFYLLEAATLNLLNQKTAAIASLLKVEGYLKITATEQLALWLYDLGRQNEINDYVIKRSDSVDIAEQGLRIIQLHEANQAYDLANALAERILLHHPESEMVRYKRALIMDTLGHWSITETELRYLLQQSPDNADYMNALGYTLLVRSQRIEEASHFIEKAHELESDNPAIIDSLGWLYFRKGDYEKATFYLEKAWRLLPDSEIGAHYGESLWQQDDFIRAIEIWQQALEYDANHPVLNETIRRLYPSLLAS